MNLAQDFLYLQCQLHLPKIAGRGSRRWEMEVWQQRLLMDDNFFPSWLEEEKKQEKDQKNGD